MPLLDARVRGDVDSGVATDVWLGQVPVLADAADLGSGERGQASGPTPSDVILIGAGYDVLTLIL